MSGLIDKLKSKSQIKEGDKITSSHGLKEHSPEKADVHISQLTGKNILVGVPGAFTGPCSKQIPGFDQHADAFASKGVQGIYVVPVNDQFATAAWKEKLGVTSKLFTRDIGLAFDATGLLGGERSKRYVAILNGNTVQKLFVEDDPTQSTVTQAEAVLQAV